MEPTRASGSGEPRERLDSADGEEPEVESLEIIGQEMVPYAGQKASEEDGGGGEAA